MHLPDNIILTKSRQVKHCPPHFVKVTIRDDGPSPFQISNSSDDIPVEAKVRNWLHENIENRFYVGADSSSEKNVFVSRTIAAFEDPMDATFFTLALNSIIKDQ